MKDPGYYWVKWDNKWFVAEVDSIGDWHIPGILSILSESDLQQVATSKIERDLKNQTIDECINFLDGIFPEIEGQDLLHKKIKRALESLKTKVFTP